MKHRWLIGLVWGFVLLLLAACGPQESVPVETQKGAGDLVSQTPAASAVTLESPSPSPPEKTALIDVATATQQVASQDSVSTRGGKWPVNTFTKQLPRLSAGNVSMSLTQDRSFELLASDLSLEEAKAYLEATIAKGFRHDVQVEDYTESGIEAYTYSARNEAGYRVNLSYSVGLLSISMEQE